MRRVYFLIPPALIALALGLWAWQRQPPADNAPVSVALPERVSLPVPAVAFTDVTNSAGIDFTHVNGAAGDKLLPETMGGGVAVIDYDRDGRPDLVFVSSCPWPGADDAGPKKSCLTLYRNLGDGTFEDATEKAGLTTTLYGMGLCVGDYNNDGYDDIFVTGVGRHQLFCNVPMDGGRGFINKTAEANLSTDTWPEALGHEEFIGHQTPIAFESSATFFDYDRDGRLDLFICRYVDWSPAADMAISSTLTGVGRAYQQPQQLPGSQCQLYRNMGGGKFRDVTELAGIVVARTAATGAGQKPPGVAKALAVAACDPDGDGYPDLVVANDTVQNFYYKNIPSDNNTRRFQEVGEEVNVAYADGRPRGAMGVDYGEYSPGQDALIIANFANEPCTFLTPVRRGQRLQFTNKALAVGLEGQAARGPLKFASCFFDYDLDGRLDIILCNGHLEPEIASLQAGQTYEQPATLFWNTGGQGRLQYEPVPNTQCGDLATPIVGRGLATLDYDGDGDLDVVLVANGGKAKLIRNDQKLGHHYLRLKLVGNGVDTNTSAIGARVTVEAGGKAFRREVTGARGYLSQSELVVTVGLGTIDTVDRVTVRWPGGPADAPPDVWERLAVDRQHTLTQKSQPAASD